MRFRGPSGAGAVFDIGKRALTSVNEKLGPLGDDKVFDAVGATRISRTRRRGRRSDDERISVDSYDSPGLSRY